MEVSRKTREGGAGGAGFGQYARPMKRFPIYLSASVDTLEE
jgi:hypothetical protein